MMNDEGGIYIFINSCIDALRSHELLSLLFGPSLVKVMCLCVLREKKIQIALYSIHQLDAPNCVKAGEGGRKVMSVCTRLVPCNRCPYGSVIKLTGQY